MRFVNYILAGVLMTLLMIAGYAWSADKMLECSRADGSTFYTNKDLKGCKALKLPELSVAPTIEYVAAETAKTILPETPVVVNSLEPVNTRLCSLYAEWMALAERTSGGFVHNTIPDIQRKLVLVQLFGAGFIPSSCK